MPRTPDLIGTVEAAQILGLHRRTVVEMAQEGKLKIALRLPGKTGSVLYRRADVIALKSDAA